jgi:hypothetical protein
VPWSKPTFFTSWSFSRLQAYRRCPLAAKLSLIDKIKEPPKEEGHPMVRGDRIHKLAEAYIKGAGKAAMPEELKAFDKELRALRKLRKADPELVVVEETWAFRKDWSITRYDDWNECWLRVKLDVARVDGTTVYPIDWKSGKFSPEWNLNDYMEQLELYALAGLLTYADMGPELLVIPRLKYTDAWVTYPEDLQVYSPGMVPMLKKKWEAAVKPMLSDRTFAPKPNRFCSTCWFRKGNTERTDGGQVCRFS